MANKDNNTIISNIDVRHPYPRHTPGNKMYITEKYINLQNVYNGNTQIYKMYKNWQIHNLQDICNREIHKFTKYIQQ